MSTVLSKDRDNESPRPRVAHDLVWEAEKLAEKYILIETCSDRGLYRMHQWERGWGGRSCLQKAWDLRFVLILEREQVFVSQGGKGDRQMGKVLKETMYSIIGYLGNHSRFCRCLCLSIRMFYKDHLTGEDAAPPLTLFQLFAFSNQGHSSPRELGFCSQKSLLQSVEQHEEEITNRPAKSF